MRVALVEERIFEDFVGFGEALLDIAKLKSDALVNVAFLAVIVDAWFGSGEGFFGIGDGWQNLVFDIDQVQRLEGRQFFARNYCRNGIADVPHMIDAECLLVLTDGENAVLDGQVFSREDQIHSGMRDSTRCVDFLDACVRMWRAQQLAVGHPRQEDVVGVASLAGDFGAGVNPSARNPDHAEFACVGA